MKYALISAIVLLASTIQAQDWSPIWDGQTLNNWSHVGEGSFAVEEGLLRTKGGMGLLYYDEGPLENVKIKVVYKNPEGRNAGVFIRIPEEPSDAWMPVNKGYEVQIDDRGDDYHITGVLYSLTKAKAKPSKPGEWNTMIITLDGPRTMVEVNGQLVTDYTEGDPVPEKKVSWEPERGPRPVKGFIGLQNHAEEDLVYFKEISLQHLKK